MVHDTAKTYGGVEAYHHALLSSVCGLPHTMPAVPPGKDPHPPSTHCIGSGLDVVVVRKYLILPRSGPIFFQCAA